MTISLPILDSRPHEGPTMHFVPLCPFQTLDKQLFNAQVEFSALGLEK